MIGNPYLQRGLPTAVAVLALGALPAASSAQEEFDELKVLIEINATDGDAGFHALGDGDAWKHVQLFNPDGEKLMMIKDHNALRDQGLTEIFFESAEPLCQFDEEEPDEEVVPLSEFLARFIEGEYLFKGVTIEGDELEGTAELTYDIPAAPDISATDEMELDPEETVIQWAPGVDLGNCHDQTLIDDGIITDPAAVALVGWEVVVEPDDEEAVSPLRVFSVQLPAGQTSVTVPPEFISAYMDDGVTEFKFEVGAIEASGNQVFSEGTFELENGEE